MVGNHSSITSHLLVHAPICLSQHWVCEIAPAPSSTPPILTLRQLVSPNEHMLDLNLYRLLHLGFLMMLMSLIALWAPWVLNNNPQGSRGMIPRCRHALFHMPATTWSNQSFPQQNLAGLCCL